MMLLRINRFQIALPEVFDLVSPMSRAVGDHHVLGTVLGDHCDTGLHCAYSMARLYKKSRILFSIICCGFGVFVFVNDYTLSITVKIPDAEAFWNCFLKRF
jgi:hypothetical protein